MVGGLGVYVPVMAMIRLQFYFAVLAIFTRAALLHGMNTTVFVVYRQAIAALDMASFALSPNRVTSNQNAYFEG
ncbi:hypothetical protein K1719_003472 [Acacia pycnantha]|nr:hypothetical protein K1719_003472 [Acacia pycnantha]